jgi:hypothetical protein
MGMSEREHHIKVLESLLSHYKAREQCEGYYDSTLKDNVEALEYAISSIKTDEAYQIMYEGGEIFTKDDMVAILTELKTEINTMSDSVVEGRTVTITSWRGMQKRICNLIQSGIDKLEETKDYPAEN